MSVSDHHKKLAEEAARRDRRENRPCDPQRYGALHGSAWEKWYIAAYRAPVVQVRRRGHG